MFLYMKGIVHKRFVPQSQTVNYELRGLREDIRQKIPQIRRDHNWMLHHDSATALRFYHKQQFSGQNSMIVLRPTSCFTGFSSM